MSRRPARRRHRSRSTRRGFTLVELMISLVMGLIVALAAVALAKTATTTFHEQARSSLTEMSVRTAAERLRQDLMRVSHMSTGNIRSDPRVARTREGLNDAVYRYADLKDLQGIRVLVGGSKAAAQGTLKLADNNLLNPDALEIAGNLTTDDAYAGTLLSGSGAAGCGTQHVRLNPLADAAVYHLVSGVLADGGVSSLATAQAAFRPVQKDGVNFAAQVTDALGCTHYVTVCGVATETAAGAVQVVVGLEGAAGQRPVLYSHFGAAGAEAEGSGMANNCGASEGGKVTIAPVHRVRWQLAATQTALAAPVELEPAGNKFDLVRQLLDHKGTPVGKPEVVAEYAVDLKFGLVVFDPTLDTAGTSPLRVFEMDTDTGTGDIHKTTRPVSDIAPGTLGPQHVRSVKFRVATRTAMADRASDIQVGEPRSASNPYMARYCMQDKALAECTKFARVRTIVSEVALHNQARMFF